MSTDAWVISVSATAVSTGNLKQLYPTWAAAGADHSNPNALPATGAYVRCPTQGALHAISVQSDGANAGTLEIWDVNGADAGADVSSADVITNTQLTALIALDKARLIYTQTIPASAGSNIVNPPGLYKSFMKGLAARFSNAGPTGACTLSLVVTGGQNKVQWI